MPATSAGGRTVKVVLEANVAGFVAAMAKASASAKAHADQIGKSLDKASTYVDKHSQTIDKIGRGFALAGAAAGASLVAVTRAAMGWESEWAGVEKTVDGTREQMAGLEAQLRAMARSMPATHQEIAAVAEAAGQLGVARENVAAFTRTMIQLGETTNLGADTGATQFAQFMNIMKTAPSDVDRLAAALVALGNNGASTEADIMALSHRLAGTANQMDISEAAVLGFANAMASVGIEAEAGGTAMSLTWKQIDAAVREGGDSLELIARTAGMTADQFSKAWGEDAAGATTSFVEGLAGVKAAGGDVNGVLDQLGINGIRQSDTLLRLAGAGDLLRESLELGAEAFADNTALAEEYAKRAQTTEAQVSVAWNRIKDAAITAGEATLPVVAGLAGGVGELADRFNELPAGAQHFTVGMGAVVAGGGLGLGVLSQLITSTSAVHQGLVQMGMTARTAGLAMGGIGIVLTAASLALGTWMSRQAEAAALADRYSDAITQQGEAVGEYSRQMAIQELSQQGALDAAKQLGVGLDTLTDAVHGNADAQTEINERIQETILSWENGTDTTREQYHAALDLNEALGKQSSAYADAAAQAELEAEALDASTSASERDELSKQKQTQKIREQEQALDQLIAATQTYGNTLVALSGSETAVASARLSALGLLQTYTDETGALTIAMNESRTEFDLNTESGLRAQQALDNLAQAGMRQIEVMVESGATHDELAAKAAELTASYVDTATQLGQNEQAAKDLADAYYAVPDKIELEVIASGVDEAQRQLKSIPRRLQVDMVVVPSGPSGGPGPGFTATPGFSAGGAVSGPGTTTSDSVIARLSRDEHVLTAAEVQAMGGHAAVYAMRAALRDGLPRYATGGPVYAQAVHRRSWVNPPAANRPYSGVRDQHSADRPTVGSVTQHVYGADVDTVWRDLGRGLRKAGLR